MQDESHLLTTRTAVSKRSLSELIFFLWQLSRWLSLDVALGALICCLMACKLMGVVPLPLDAAGVLAGTVLLIYTLDHLLDIWQTNGKVFSPRRQFHWRFRKELLIGALLLCCLLGIVTLLFLPPSILIFGAALALLVLVYLWLVRLLGVSRGKRWFHKELLIACLYTAGIWGVAFMYSTSFGLVDIYLTLAFGLIALQNLFLFSYFEKEEDLEQGQRSMVLHLGSHTIKRLFACIFGLSAVFIYQAWIQSNDIAAKQVAITEALMSGILLLLLAFPSYFSQHKRYRWIGDGIFLLPLWMFL